MLNETNAKGAERKESGSCKEGRWLLTYEGACELSKGGPADWMKSAGCQISEHLVDGQTAVAML